MIRFEEVADILAPNPPRKHHYVPEAYLRQWVGSDGRLERFTKPHANKIDVRRVPPSEAAWALALYQSPEHEPDRRQYLETEFFQVVDSAAAIVLRKLLEPEPKLSPQERFHWAVFINSLLHRTPENLEAYKAGGKRLLSDTLVKLRTEYDAARGPNDPATYEQYVLTRTRDHDERSLLGVLPQVILGSVTDTIAEMPWRIIDVAGADNQLLISDYPVVRSNGLRVPMGHLAMPLSPSKLFITAPERSTFDALERMPLNQLVRNANQEVVGCACRFVGATDRQQETFIRNRFGRKPALRFHGSST